MDNNAHAALPASVYQAIVNAAPDAVILADAQGAIRLWNAAAEAMFGYAASEVLGKSLDVIIPERFRKAHWNAFDKALATGETKYAGRSLTTRSQHKDGRALYVEMSFALMKDSGAGAGGALAFVRDCTERYLAEKASRPGAATQKPS
jgi:PAS domain S-box-containing protein